MRRVCAGLRVRAPMATRFAGFWRSRRSMTGHPHAGGPNRWRDPPGRARWVLRFNALGPSGLTDRKAPGQPSRLGDEHRAALAALNPQENVWQFMRDNWLSNRVFDNTGALIDHCCAAWTKLEAQPWIIMSLGLRDWAHRF